MGVRSARAECFRKANKAASAAVGDMTSGTDAESQATGMDAYRLCRYEMGIRP